MDRVILIVFVNLELADPLADPLGVLLMLDEPVCVRVMNGVDDGIDEDVGDFVLLIVLLIVGEEDRVLLEDIDREEDGDDVPVLDVETDLVEVTVPKSVCVLFGDALKESTEDAVLDKDADLVPVPDDVPVFEDVIEPETVGDPLPVFDEDTEPVDVLV